MVVYAEFAIDASDFHIGRAFADLPGVRVELDRIVPTTDAVIPFLWVDDVPPEDVVRVARSHEAVDEIEPLDRYDGHGTLFRVVWSSSVRDAITHIVESDLTLLAANGTATTWRFEFRAASAEPFASFQDDLEAGGTPARLVRLTESLQALEGADGDLTDDQREALSLAYERGYFDEPRGVAIEDLAADVGISRQAFSGRLRRGTRTLVADAISTTE